MQHNCKDCPYAAQLASEAESYYMCTPLLLRRTVDVGQDGAPEWCPAPEIEASMKAQEDAAK